MFLPVVLEVLVTWRFSSSRDILSQLISWHIVFSKVQYLGYKFQICDLVELFFCVQFIDPVVKCALA